MIVFSKEVIENFAKPVSEEVVNLAYSNLSFIIDNAMSELKKINPFIISYEIIAANEFFSGAILPNSQLTVFLAIDSPQLELNTINAHKNKFKNFFIRVKQVWKEQKKKKHHKYINNEQDIKIKELNQKKEKYNIPIFNVDLLNAITKFITQSELVTLNKGILQIIGDVQPFKVNIIPVIKKSNSFNFFAYDKNKFVNIDFKERKNNLLKLSEVYGEKYYEICRIFSNLYYSINEELPNSIFIESLIANLPQSAFNMKKDIYNSFIFAVNYLCNTKLSELFSIINTKQKIYEDSLCGVNYYQLTNFFRQLTKLI